MNAPCPGNPEVTVQWIESLLREKERLANDESVSNVEVAPLDANRGFIGSMRRIIVTLTPLRTLQLILKMGGTSDADRKAVAASRRWREAQFYTLAESILGKTSAPDVLPDVLYAHYSDQKEEYTVLMENVMMPSAESSLQTVPVNFVFGNQIWGSPVRKFSVEEQDSLIRVIYETVAKVHALHWNDPALLQNDWMKAATWYRGLEQESWEKAAQMALGCWEAAKSRLHGPSQDEATDLSAGHFRMNDRFVALVDRSFAATNWQALQAHLHDKHVPFTMCHGDFHSSNMFVILRRPANHDNPSDTIPEITRESIATVKWFDWSEVGPWEPCADLGQILISDVKPQLFVAHARSWIEVYWNTLVQELEPKFPHIRTEFPWDACWEIYSRGSIERWIWLFGVVASLPAVPVVAIQYFHDQLCAFIEAFGDMDTGSYPLKLVVCFR
eukprot:ANDGO_02170.mRNA.1 aminoglycoside phosphotransferase